MAPALLSKDKKQRPKVASHFKLAEVNMEALNDPLPPHHPGSPKALMIPSLALETLPSEGGQFRPFRNYGEEDRAVTSPAATISNYTSVQSGLMQKETIYYPHVTNETRRLLSEVANIRKQYEHRSINELAADPPPIVTKKVVAKKTKKLKKVSNQVVMKEEGDKNDINLQSSTSIHQKSYPLKKRIVTHVDSMSFGLTSLAMASQSKSKSSDKQHSPKTDLHSGKVTSENGHVAKDEESNQATLSNISENCFSKGKEQQRFEEMKPDHGAAAAVPESLQSAKDCGKPWRKNMKVKQENDEGETKVPEDGEDEMKINPKPWRHNMKQSLSVEKAKQSEPTEAEADGSCHVRTRPRDHEKVKKFIKDKRRKASEERKAQQEDSRRKKTQVQERLLALDAFRKTQDIMAKTNQQSTSDVVLRLRKQEEEDQLKTMLQKLTDEMKAQHYLGCEGESTIETTLLPEEQNHMLSLTPVKENTKLTSPNLLVTEEATNISTKNNSRKGSSKDKSVALSQFEGGFSHVQSKTTQSEERATPNSQPAAGKPNTFKSQLEKISVKHKEVINTIKACEPDLIATPKKPLMPDNFNVMSSAMRRKLQDQSYDDDDHRNQALEQEEKSIDLTVSEGPLLSDYSDSTVSKSKKGSKSARSTSSKNDIDDIPVRDSSTPIEKDDQQVPLALQLRFQAELNQMESIQEAERQLHQINQMRDVVTARNETAIYAQALVSQNKVTNVTNQSKMSKREEKSSRSSRETRSQFEERMRRELQDLFSSRMAELMQHQMEATKMTVEAANQLTKMHTKKKSHRTRTAAAATSSSKAFSNNEDIKSIISKTESSIPEILNVVEATDRSAKDIQRSIKTAIEELSLADNDNSKTSNITEEIMAELTDDYDFSSKKSSRSDKNDDEEDDEASTSCSSSSWFTGNLFLQHLEDQRVRDKQQYTMIKRREKVLTMKTKEALKDISDQRREFALDESKVRGLGSKEKKIRKKYRKQKTELANLLQALQVAEKERQLLFRQHKKLSHFKSKDLSSSKMSSTASDYSGSSASNAVISEEDLPVQEASTKHRQRQTSATIKTPLSPKRTTPIRPIANRRRHSSAESEDSISFISTSQVETVSSAGDQSDLELRVHTLKDELREREKTAARLKKEQKLARQERLKAQEEALKKQIEVYDNIIQQTKSDIEVNISAAASSASSSASPSPRITQPQIKIPKQQSRPDSQLSCCETITSKSTPQASLSIDEESTSTDTIIASPQKPATPANMDEVHEAANLSCHNNNYSDDFTSSVSSNPPTPAKLASEKSVDALCGQLLEAMIEDTVGRMKSKQESKLTCSEGEVDEEATNKSSLAGSRPKSKSPPVVNHMQTTFDVSSESSEEEEEVAKETTEDDTTVAPDELPEEQSVHANTGDDGDFIDDDFGLSLKKEWDHLRQQQMLIEEEISSIQKDSVEASKPPPPYSPPTVGNLEGQRSPRKLAVQVKPESPRFVPSSKDQLAVLVDDLVDRLLQNRDRLDEMNIEADKHIECLTRHALQPDQLDKESQRIFVRFLFDMTKDIMKEVYSVEKEDQNPPWMRQKSLTFGIRNVPASTEELQTLVRRRVLVAFNHEKRAAKENLIIRWSHKRRDRVDQVLVRELHGEESTWIDYEVDEIQVKDELSNTLLDSLISDTVHAFKKVPAAFSCQA